MFPGQIVPGAFGSTAATLSQDAKMAKIEAKILRVMQSSIMDSVFATIAPSYTNQPEAALKHVY